MRCGIDVVDEAGHVLLVLKRCLQRLQVAGELLVGLGDGQKLHLAAVLVQVIAENHRMVAIFLGLDLVPVGKAFQALLFVVVGKRQVQVRRVELFVDLVVEQFVDLVVHG